MKGTYAVLLSLAICAVAALLEGVCAGKEVKPFFGSLKFPRYSAPLWVWSIIGGLYYVVFWFVLYRLFQLTPSPVKYFAVLLITVMMIFNGLTNLIIFRAKNLRLSFIVGALFPILDLTLLSCLIRLDKVAAWALAPYLVYRVYGVWWGYGLWQLNKSAKAGFEHSPY